MDGAPRQNRVISDQEAENISRLEELAYEIRVEQVMTSNPYVFTTSQTMREATVTLRQMRISGAPVLHNGDLVGILSIEDVIRCLIEPDLDSPVTKYMTTKLITIRATDLLVDALKMFVNTKLGRLPVIDLNGKLVGIITKGDVTRGLLKALQQETQVEEMRRYRASRIFEDIESDRTSLILRYDIQAHDFTHGGSASSRIKRALIRLGASPQIARRAGIAIYEAEMNLIIHTTKGGVIRVEIEPHQISIDVYDYGPGIADVQKALQPGYSTASEEIRELGFGAGMGLVNIARCTDSMSLDSVVGKGTRLRIKIFLPQQEAMGEGPVPKETAQ